MLHKLFEPGAWFRAKSHGYGAGLPIVWQGWLLMTAHILLILGISLLFMERLERVIPLILLAAVAPFPIYAARTEGGWKWRWGGK